MIAHGNKILNAASPNQHAFELLKKFIPVLEIFYKLCSRDFLLESMSLYQVALVFNN